MSGVWSRLSTKCYVPWVYHFASRASAPRGPSCPDAKLISPCSETVISCFPTELGLVVPAGASLGKAVGAVGSPVHQPSTHASQ